MYFKSKPLYSYRIQNDITKLYRDRRSETMLYRLKSYSLTRELYTITVSGDEYSRWKKVTIDIDFLIDIIENDGKLNEEFILRMYDEYNDHKEYSLIQMERILKLIKI